MDFRNGYAVFEGRQRSLTEFIHFRIQRYVFSQLFSRYFVSFLRYFIAWPWQGFEVRLRFL